MNAILPRPESRHVIAAKLNAHEQRAAALRALMGEFAALDTRPMLFDGDTVTHIGPDPVPENLRAMYRDEIIAIRALQLELANCPRY